MVLRKLNLGKLGKGKLKDVFQPRKDKLYWDYHGSRIDLNRNATGEDAFCPSVRISLLALGPRRQRVLLSLILILQLSPQTKAVCELDFPPFLIWAIFSFSLKKLIALLKYTIVSCFLKGFASVMRIKAPITVVCTPNFVTVTRPRLTPLCASLICRGRRDTGRGRLRHGST